MVANTGGSLLLLTCLALGTVVQARWLNQFVRHFEPLSYPPLPVHRGHMRVRRSLAHREQQRPGHVYLRFGGFNRIFQLKLRPDTSVFHKDLVVETSRFGRVKPDISHIYSGELVGDPSSRVFGGLHGGVFEGSIQSRRGHFYVEAAHKFFSRGTPFHSLLYSIRDVRMPSAGGAHGWCGVRGETARWMSQLAAHSRLVQPPHKERPPKRTNLERWLGRRPLEVAKHTEDYDDVEADDDDDDDDVDDGHGGGSNSSRRSSRRSRPHPNRVCGLFVSIDHLLYEKFSEADAGDPVRTRERLSTLIAGHVARASQVYRKTSFGGIQDVSFNVHRIQINDTSSCQKSRTGFCQENMDPSLFLLTLAKWKKFDDYCLAYAWTYRDFDSAVVLLYEDSTEAHVTGVCVQFCLGMLGEMGKHMRAL
ncbi:disintegrin and metalloproteinase domain-containing protein 10-like [Haemaphysalis longicornis]